MPSLNVVTTDAGRAAILAADLAGLHVSITQVAAGTSNYDPETRRDAISLLAEQERVDIVSSEIDEPNLLLHINALFAGATEYWIREVGFFDENGTLIWLWSSSNPADTLGFKSIPVRFLLGLTLTIVDVPVSAVQIIDAGQPLELSLAYLEELIANLTLVTIKNATFTPEVPILSSDYPEIITGTNKLTNIAGSNTGSAPKVNISLTTQQFTLGEEVISGQTCRMGTWSTAPFVSPTLDASTVYYLRAQITDGAPVFYVTKGADTDPIPASFRGTVNGANGGGFDSTPVDILLAKVVTGSVSAVPTVTPLVNAAHLSAITIVDVPDISPVASWSALPSGSLTINWARTPINAQPSIQGITSVANKPNGVIIGGAAEYENMRIFQFRKADSSSRYTLAAEYAYEDSSGNHGGVRLLWTAFA